MNAGLAEAIAAAVIGVLLTALLASVGYLIRSVLTRLTAIERHNRALGERLARIGAAIELLFLPDAAGRARRWTDKPIDDSEQVG